MEPNQKQNIELNLFDVSGSEFRSVMTGVTEEVLFVYYMDGKEFVYGKPMISPFLRANGYPEKDPSFVIYKGKKDPRKPIFIDFGLGVSGNVFTFIQLKKGLSYEGVKKLIVDDFWKNGRSSSMADVKMTIVEIPIEEAKKTLLGIKKQNFTAADAKFWKKFGISIATLKEYNVSSCKHVSSTKEGERKIIRTYSKTKPIYAYEYGKDAFKVYCPEHEKQFKWLFQGKCSDHIEGFDQLNAAGELLIITKSLKDVMLLREFGYDAISLQSESARMTEKLDTMIKRRFSQIIVFYDNDEAGIRGAINLCDLWGYKSVKIESRYLSKDISDFYKKFGEVFTRKLLEDMLSKFTDDNPGPEKEHYK